LKATWQAGCKFSARVIKLEWKNVCGRNGGKETMKIALINENSQAAKNAMIEGVLRKVVEAMGHEVVNYGFRSLLRHNPPHPFPKAATPKAPPSHTSAGIRPPPGTCHSSPSSRPR